MILLLYYNIQVYINYYIPMYIVHRQQLYTIVE